jgi:hypothetical protein
LEAFTATSFGSVASRLLPPGHPLDRRDSESDSIGRNRDEGIEDDYGASIAEEEDDENGGTSSSASISSDDIIDLPPPRSPVHSGLGMRVSTSMRSLRLRRGSWNDERSRDAFVAGDHDHDQVDELVGRLGTRDEAHRSRRRPSHSFSPQDDGDSVEQHQHVEETRLERSLRKRWAARARGMFGSGRRIRRGGSAQGEGEGDGVSPSQDGVEGVMRYGTFDGDAR